jgi:uncharacterized membrane protein
MGIIFAVCDGLFGGLAAWSQAIAIESKQVSTGVIVCFTGCFPVVTILFSWLLNRQTFHISNWQTAGMICIGLSLVCFLIDQLVTWPSIKKEN